MKIEDKTDETPNIGAGTVLCCTNHKGKDKTYFMVSYIDSMTEDAVWTAVVLKTTPNATAGCNTLGNVVKPFAFLNPEDLIRALNKYFDHVQLAIGPKMTIKCLRSGDING